MKHWNPPPPKILGRRPASGNGDFVENVRWLRANAAGHAGKWAALSGGALVDSDPSCIALKKRLSTHPDVRKLLVVHVDSFLPRPDE